MPGIPFIVSAPSGAGKTTLCNMALGRFPDMRLSVSYTTRAPRDGERNGVEYWFVDDAAFDRMVRDDEFIEYAGVHGKRYGTSRKDLEALLAQGLDVLLDIDVQGAAKVKRRLDGGVYIFIAPPSLDECRRRLVGRAKDGPAEIEKRVKNALDEIARARDYDYIIINDDLEESFIKLASVISAEKSRRERMLGRLTALFGRKGE